jgi:hypothetical protein
MAESFYAWRELATTENDALGSLIERFRRHDLLELLQYLRLMLPEIPSNHLVGQ